MSMTYDHTGHQRFSGAVNQFDVNYQTPRKEPAMLKPTIDHVSAIARAEGDVIKSIVANMSPHHRKAIEDDMERLAEVKKYILDTIYHPGLPILTESLKEPGDNGHES